MIVKWGCRGWNPGSRLTAERSGMTPSVTVYSSFLCRVCGTEASQRIHNVQVCSLKCMYRLRSKRKTCQQCGIEFDAWQVKVKFCSRRCASLKRWGPPRQIICKNCGSEFQFKCKVRDRVFCSQKCWREYDKKFRRNTYRGGRRADRGWTWDKRKSECLERDDNACQSKTHSSLTASKRKEKCSVDHIIPYRVVMWWNSRGEKFDPNDLRNLICLCRRCHQVKTSRIEAVLFRKDVVGFLSELRKFLPPSVVDGVEVMFDLNVSTEIEAVSGWNYQRKPPGIKTEKPNIRGEKHWNAKLALSQVEEIIRRKDEPREILAKEFNVHRRYIGYIIQGRKWSWVPRKT